MKKLISAILILVASACGLAQTVVPDVAPLAAKYEADIKALDASRAAAVSRVQENYLADLAAAERAASAAGKVAEVAAILKARAAIASKSPDPSPLPGMSKAQAKRHADYHAALTAVDREFAPRYGRLNADCLRTLASIESRLPANSPARGEIEALKAKLVGGAASGGALVERLRGTKWQWWESQTIEFNTVGKGTFRDGNRNLGFRWRATPDGKVLYNRDDEPAKTFTLEFEEDVVKIINPKGASWKGRNLGKVN